VDLGLPGAEARTGPRAVRAALLAMPAVAGPQLLFDVEGLVHALPVVVAQDVVRTGHHAARASRTQARGHDLLVEVLPVGGPLFGRCHDQTLGGMPELAEVEKYRRLAEDAALGREIARVFAPDDWYLK